MIRMSMGRCRPKGIAWLNLTGLSAAFLVLLVTGAARADRISDVSGEISITDATVEPARRGAYTNIHAQVGNGGPKTVTLKSVETKLGERGAFDIHAGLGSVHNDSLSLSSGEQASFDDGRFRLTLGPLQRDLNEGDVVEITFTFGTFEMLVPAHVHAGPSGPDALGDDRR